MTSPNDIIGNYVIERNLGKGSFANVWLARHISMGFYVAVKDISKSSLDTTDSITRFNREISLLKKIDHPFIAQLFEVIETERAYYLIMEYASNGNMLEFVNRNGRINENIARRYFAQLLSSLDYLHNQQYVAHRDLKAENVMLDKYNNIRLIDFGLSNVFSRSEPALNTSCGSPAYAAPEMIRGLQYTKAADIWSLGVLLYAMIVGKLPYDDPNVQVLLGKILNTEVTYPPTLSRSLIDLLKQLMCKNPEQRISMAKIKLHPWFSQGEYNTMMGIISSDYPGFTDLNNNRKVDRDIVNQISIFGYDAKNIVLSLINNEFNELTAVYKCMKKNSFTEKMKDIHIQVQRQSSTNNNQFPSHQSTGFYQNVNTAFQPINPMVNHLPVPNMIVNHLPTPNTQGTVTRRLSRPVVFQKFPFNPTAMFGNIQPSLEVP